MLYLEDYLELIEHLPQELRDRFTELRTKDLQVQNSNEQLKEKVELTFAEAAHKPDRKPEQCDYQNLLDEYQASMRIADDKVQIANNMYDIMVKLVQRLDSELEKFKLELEADHAGITEELEKRSLELDADSRLEAIINNHLNNDTSVNSINNNNRSLTSTPSLFNHNSTSKLPSGVKARRRSEQKHRHHPYNNNNLINNNNQQHISNGYNNHHGRGKLSHQDHTNSSTLSEHHSKKSFNNRIQQNNNFVSSCRQQATTSPSQYFNNISGYHSSSSISAPASVAGDLNSMDASGHYGNNLLSSFGNNQSFKTNSTSNKNNNLQNISNSQFNHQHSALSAALSTNTPQPLNSVSALAMLNATSAAVAASANNQSNSNNQKISSMYIAGNHDFIDPHSPLVRQNPLAAAASQAIAATQQLQQGRRTPSLKASFAAINAAGSGLLDNHGKHVSMAKHDVSGFGANRNALAPMAPDQQAFRINGFHSGNKNQLNGSSTATNPLYISTTKSGRTSKKTAKHHNQQQRNTSHLYPDESPTSISSDNNSVFDNSESLSSTDFIETGTNFGSTSSPSSLDFSTNATQGNTTLYQRDETKYCLCRQISYGEMVACDNNDCEFEWFHYDCVNVTQPPKGKWYCPDCSRKMASNHQNQSSQALKKGSRKEKTASM